MRITLHEVEWYNQKIEMMKVMIRRLQAEKRIAILREKENVLKDRHKTVRT